MTNFTGASQNRTSRPATVKSSAIASVRNGDVIRGVARGDRHANGGDNRGWRAGSSRPDGSRR